MCQDHAACEVRRACLRVRAFGTAKLKSQDADMPFTHRHPSGPVWLLRAGAVTAPQRAKDYTLTIVTKYKISFINPE